MKSVVSVLNFDFRDLLPFLDRGVYKTPLVFCDLWRKLGDKYEEKRWDRILRKYRARVISVKNQWGVSGEYDDSSNRIKILINPKELSLDTLKFATIQTVMHELIHVHQNYCHAEQYERIISDRAVKGEHEEYMCKFGEIQAYAHCAALEYLVGIEDTINRYDEFSVKTKRLFLNLMFRWVNKYISLTNLSIEPNEQHTTSNI